MPADSAHHFPAPVLRRIVWLWLAFCVMKIGGAVLLYHAELGLSPWKPLLWEGSSLFVVSVLVGLALKFSKPSRHLHGRPWLWWRDHLLFFPLLCLIFIPATYGLRHAGYALLGEVYRHASWPRVAAYESMTLGIFYLLWLGVMFGLATHHHLLDEQRRAQHTASALREAQLALLRQQLQPHFLFNSLNLISAAMYEDVPNADLLLRKLASLLRQASAQTAQPMHGLGEEISLLRDYADIMCARFEGRVELSWQVADDTPECRVPSMISQPLLENAFKHGVEPFAGASHLEVRLARLAGDRLALSVCQDRGEYAADARCAENTTGIEHAQGGLGLANVRRRLAAHYGDDADLQITRRHPEGVCATITFPCAS